MTEYEDNAEFKQAVADMIADVSLPEFNPIREQEVVIFSQLVIRTDNVGEHVACKGDPILCKKIPAPFQALTGGHYLVMADYYFWNHADEINKKAALYHALMHIDIEKDKKGKIKLGTRKPDIKVFRGEIAHYGACNDLLLDFREAFKLSSKTLAQSMKLVTAKEA